MRQKGPEVRFRPISDISEYRSEGKLERLPELAAQLVALNVDVIVTLATPGALAAKKATNTIPIVVAAMADPARYGLVTSLARPGGNITGLSSMGPELKHDGFRFDSLSF